MFFLFCSPNSKQSEMSVSCSQRSVVRAGLEQRSLDFKSSALANWPRCLHKVLFQSNLEFTEQRDGTWVAQGPVILRLSHLISGQRSATFSVKITSSLYMTSFRAGYELAAITTYTCHARKVNIWDVCHAI